MANISLHPKGWKPAKGYANGMLAEGRTVYVGGQIGWTADQVFETDDFIEQMQQALRNIIDVVQEAGGEPKDIVRLTWFVTDKREYLEKQSQVGKAYRDVMGYNFPAMTMVVVADLIEDQAKIEIEATAVLPT
ncbi:RidA family protein [Maritalea sp.]|jgi:enamine deaminase RidA (YjgF/YER057c/UK114 family)|uniref:RidA family protein n=1 Tax=Maritalea sp. TaxID=2003361 RepID=UPI0039E3581E